MTQMQEAYEKIRAHLIKQGVPAGNERGICYYRHGDLKCAVGCLIDDAAYTPVIEGNSVYDDTVREALTQSGWALDADLIEMLEDMQSAHDVWLRKGFTLDRVISTIDGIALSLGLTPAK